jgi:hypothetical protein
MASKQQILNLKNDLVLNKAKDSFLDIIEKKQGEGEITA